jgi:hypothetical protein
MTLEPYILLNEFSLLRVNYSIRLVLLWIGNGKDILVPFKSRHVPWKRKALLSVPYMDEKTNRLVASSKLNQFLKNENLTVEKGRKSI